MLTCIYNSITSALILMPYTMIRNRNVLIITVVSFIGYFQYGKKGTYQIAKVKHILLIQLSTVTCEIDIFNSETNREYLRDARLFDNLSVFKRSQVITGEGILGHFVNILLLRHASKWIHTMCRLLVEIFQIRRDSKRRLDRDKYFHSTLRLIHIVYEAFDIGLTLLLC